MRLKGWIISKEYQKIVWVRVDKGGEYVCDDKDLKNLEQLSNS